MPNYFPCPNAQCTYQFDADLLPPAAMVTCPICRTRFPYRVQQPVMAGVEPAASPAAPEPQPVGPRLLTIKEVPKGGGILTTILWVAGFCIVLAGLVVMLARRGGNNFTGTPQEAADQTFNIKVEPFPSSWDTDAGAMRTVEANILGRKRTSPEAWAAVAAKDWKDREPRTSELEEMIRNRLREAFGSLELEPIEGETWSGHQALGFRFAGLFEDAQVRGVAYAMSFKGIGYVYFGWSEETNWEAVRAEVPGLRERIRTAGYRDRWEARRANVEVHVPDAGGYQLEDRDEAWARGREAVEGRTPKKTDFIIEDVKEFDPNATMVFRARYQRKERGDNLRKPAEALALVVELPGGGDPLEAARAHVIERIKKDYAGTPPDIKLEPMNRSTAGVALPTGGPAIGRFLFQDPLSRTDRTVYVISAISQGGKTIACTIHATEKDASFVEEWMVNLAGSLRARAGQDR